MIGVYFTIYFLIPRYILKGKPVTFAFSVIALLIVMFLNTLLLDQLFGPSWGMEDFSLIKTFFQSTVTISFILALASTIKILRYYHSIKIEKVNIENINLQNELTILKNQITPHFLFNVLNNIDELMYIDREKASAAIYQLSNILRSMLGEMNNEVIFLETEVKFIDDYLKLASYNFKTQKSIEIVKQGDFSGKTIAPMLFLPLVENAIKYADRNALNPVISIKISANSSISFLIKNRTKGKDQNSESTGIGLINLKKRLDHIYPQKYELNITKYENLFSVELTLNPSPQ